MAPFGENRRLRPPSRRFYCWATRSILRQAVIQSQPVGGSMLTLYFAPGSSSMAPHIALHEIGCPFEAVPVSFAKEETKGAAFRAVNPVGQVPTLLIDGRPLTEVAGILWYLARAFPAARLAPVGDAEAEAPV